MSSLKQKLSISIFSAVLFTVVNLSQTYKLTNFFTGIKTLHNGCRTNSGILLHTIVFFLLTYISMGNPLPLSGLKLKFSVYGTLIFYFVASPALYSLTKGIFGNMVSSNGCPTLYGLLLHAAIFCAILLGVMYFPEVSSEQKIRQ